MIQHNIIGLLAAIDFFLKTLAAHEALGALISTYRPQMGRTVESWGGYTKSWESLFQTCLDALTLTSNTLGQVEGVLLLQHVSNAELRDALGSAFGASDRFRIVLRNYESALRGYNEARDRFLGDRTRANYELREAADTSRGTWYRELHVVFTRYEKALKKLDSVRDQLIAESRRSDGQ